MTPSFIFGGNTGQSYDDLQRKRRFAEALLARGQSGAPKTALEGINSGAKSIVGALMMKKIGERDEANRRDYESRRDSALGGLFGGGGMGGGQPYAAAVDPNSPQGIANDAMTALGKGAVDPGLIKAGLVQRGLPEHVANAFVMNFKDESGLNPGINEASPMVPGSRGGFGLAQWTGPRRVALEKYAADRGVMTDDLNTQLDFLMSELAGPESQAAKAIFSAPDTGSAAAAIVNDFLRPAEQHRVTRAAQYAQGGGEEFAALTGLLSDPYASDGDRMILSKLLENKIAGMQPPDPMDALQMQKAQLEIDALRNPTPKPIEVGGVLLDPNTYQPIFDSRMQDAPKPTDDMREYEFARSQGYQGSLQDFILEGRRAGATSVRVGDEAPPNDAALRKKLGEKEGESWASYQDAGTVSSGTVQDMEMIDELVGLAPQGPISGRLAGAFPGVSSAADAFNSVVKRVAPTLRAPGSGSTSDIEYEGMLKSLPQLSSKPEANRAIAAMVKAKAKINIERAGIVSAYQNGEIDVAEARKRMSQVNSQSIMTPELKAVLSGLAPSGAGSAPDGVPQEEWDAMSAEDRALWEN